MPPHKSFDSNTLSPLAARILIEAPLGTDVNLPRAGSALENAHVYDAVARELQRASEEGRLRIVDQRIEAGLICHLVFRRSA
jgi:hypothetical protein